MKTLIIFVLLSTCNAFISTVNSFTVKSGGPTIKMLDYVPNQIIRSMNTRIIPEWSYSNFVDEISKKHIDSVSILDNSKGFVVIDNNYVDKIDATNLHVVKSFSEINTNLIDLLTKFHVPFDVFAVNPGQETSVFQILGTAFQWGIIFVILSRILPMVFGMGGPPGIQQGSEFEVVEADDIEQKFEDVAGIDVVKNELVEIVDYLKNPTKFAEVGAEIPKGVLMEGQPGVGKTLLARAVAGEAGVPFISVSGSQFIEMYVGLGASRVRKLFDLARTKEKCIIFIDEIDAIGKQRGNSGVASGGNEEREQTLNQILTEMDGFKQSSGIIIMAATNRVDLLDSALVRPGRFDRKITIPLPNLNARKKIIDIYLGSKVVSENINIAELATMTTGFSGAEIKNLINEAAILAARENSTIITKENLLDSFEKIQIGLPLDTGIEDPELSQLVAYHEAGHVLCTLYFNSIFNFTKATIRATNSGAGGYTLFTPLERMNSYPTKKYFLSQLIISMGGRAAESILYKNKQKYDEDYVLDKYDDDLFVTTGATGDLQQANTIAKNYITTFGFGEEFLLYKDMEMYDSHTSDITKNKIDKYTEDLISTAYGIAKKILSINSDNLDYVSNLLMSNQTITAFDNPINIKYITTNM